MDSKERLFRRLREMKLLRNDASESALRSVSRGAFVPPELVDLGDCDVPLPCKCGDAERFIPSLRLTALLLEAVGPMDEQRIAVIDSRGGYVAAVMAAAAEHKGAVTAVEFDLSDEETVLRNLERAGMLEQVEVMSFYAFMAKSSTFTRILVLADELTPKELISQVSDLGYIVSRGGPEGLALARHVRSGDDLLEMLYGDVRLIGEKACAQGKQPPLDMDVSKVLGLEDIMSHVWSGRFAAEKEMTVAELVKETCKGGPLDMIRHGWKDKQRVAALKAFHAGYLCQSMGYLEDAEDLYRASLAIMPSAEAHTFLGWRFSFDGRYEEAIKECKGAIEVDSTLGNPCNDIGAYLIELGRLDEAVEWLQRAIESERYCCPCYAHCNLGRVYLMKGMGRLAKREFEKALEINPEYDLARELLDRADAEQDYFG